MFFSIHFYTLLWAGFILAVSFWSGSSISKIGLWRFPHSDKIMHLICYAILALLMNSSATKQYGFRKKQYYISGAVFFICVSYGIMIEILQPVITPDRVFDYFDIAANVAGCVVGIFIYRYGYLKFQD